MSIQTAAYHLALAVRDERTHRATADERLRGLLEEEVDIALRAIDDALSPGWDGSEPCRECDGKGSHLESPRAGNVSLTPCGSCNGTGRKVVLVQRMAAE